MPSRTFRRRVRWEANRCWSFWLFCWRFFPFALFVDSKPLTISMPRPRLDRTMLRAFIRLHVNSYSTRTEKVITIFGVPRVCHTCVSIAMTTVWTRNHTFDDSCVDRGTVTGRAIGAATIPNISRVLLSFVLMIRHGQLQRVCMKFKASYCLATVFPRCAIAVCGFLWAHIITLFDFVFYRRRLALLVLYQRE